MAGAPSDFEKLARRIDSYRDQMVEAQKELTALAALGPENGGQGEWKRAILLKEKLRAMGVTNVTEYNAKDERVPEGTRPNLVVRVPGRQSQQTVWVMAHMDIVPPGDLKQWQTQPFEAVVKDGKIFGRGVEDNQQGLVSALFAVKALMEEGVTPTSDVALLLVSDEETGNKYGIDHVMKVAPGLVKKDDLVIVPDSGTPAGDMVEVAEKSILWCELTVRGKQVHASMPHQGNNAHRAAAHLTIELDRVLHERYAREDPVYDPPPSTFEPTKKEANVPNINTIPGEDRFCFDCRVLPEYSIEEVKKTIQEVAAGIEKRFAVKITVRFPQCLQAAPATPADAPVVRELSRAIAAVRKVQAKPMGIGGGTVAAAFRMHGVPAAVWSTMDDMAHQPNEYCLIDNLVEDAKVFAHVFCR